MLVAGVCCGEDTCSIYLLTYLQGWSQKNSILRAIRLLNSSLNLTFLELGQHLHYTGTSIFEIEKLRKQLEIILILN